MDDVGKKRIAAERLRQLRELADKRRPYPERLDRQQQSYHRMVAVRSRVMMPFVRLLARAGVPADAVSYIGVLMMAAVIPLVRDYPGVAFGLVLGSALADNVDGVLAHHTGTANDRGKLVDMVCDSASFALFTAGIAHAGLVEGALAVLLAYFLVISKVFRSVKNAFYLKTDWHFKAVAGFVPNLAVAICYAALGVWAIWSWDVMEEVAYAMTALLALDSTVFYVRVLRATREDAPGPTDES